MVEEEAAYMAKEDVHCHVYLDRILLLAQRPITLVLMMINSCSYSTNDLVFM